MTTGQAIRDFCKECVNSNQTKVIKDCGGEFVIATKKPCALFKYRLKGKGTVKAIRRNCLECMGNSSQAVENCTTDKCQLYKFRLGKIPLERMGVIEREKLQNRFKSKSKAMAQGN